MKVIQIGEVYVPVDAIETANLDPKKGATIRLKSGTVLPCLLNQEDMAAFERFMSMLSEVEAKQ